MGEGGVWVEKSGEGASLLPQLGQWPPANSGTIAADRQTRTFWLSRGSAGWPMTESPTSESSWPRQ